MEWFQSAIEDSEDKDLEISDEALQEIVSEYIHRTDEDLTEEKAQRRPGRPPSSLENQLTAQQESEEKEFKSGIWIPDIRNKALRERLERWNGDWSGLNTLKFIRVVKNGPVKDSSFPPKGLS